MFIFSTKLDRNGQRRMLVIDPKAGVYISGHGYELSGAYGKPTIANTTVGVRELKEIEARCRANYREAANVSEMLEATR